MPEALLKFMQLSKVDTRANLLYGVFTAEVLDKTNEIADYDSTKAAFKKFSDEYSTVSGGKNLGTVRKMHTLEIAGGIKSIDYDDMNKRISGCVEVTPEIAQQAAKGWLNGFSIGGGYGRKWADPVNKGATRFAPIIAELSVVDNPCVPDATFDDFAKDASFAVMKEDGTEELRKFVTRPAPEVLTKYAAKDGSIHDTLDAALAKNKEIAAAAKPDPVEAALKKIEALGEDKKEEKEALKKIAGFYKLEKGMYDVARCASIVADLEWLTACVTEEAAFEEDGSDQPKALKGILKTLCGFLKDMVAEETKEITTAKAFDGMTEGHVELLRKVSGKVDLFKDWKAPVVEDKEKTALNDLLKTRTIERDEAVQKAEALQKKLDEVPARIEGALEKLNKRMKAIEEQPVGSGAPMFVVEKDKEVNTVKPLASRMSPGDFANQL